MPQVTMVRNGRLAKRILTSTFGITLAVAGVVRSTPAPAQCIPPPGVYQRPPGYYYYPNYGCAPVGYFYGLPYYAYLDFGFDFFYGPGWRWGWRGGPVPWRAAARQCAAWRRWARATLIIAGNDAPGRQAPIWAISPSRFFTGQARCADSPPLEDRGGNCLQDSHQAS